MTPVKYSGGQSIQSKCSVNSTVRNIFVCTPLSVQLMSQRQSLRSRIREESVKDINFLKATNFYALFSQTIMSFHTLVAVYESILHS